MCPNIICMHYSPQVRGKEDQGGYCCKYVITQMHNLPVLEMAFSFLVMAREEVVAQQLLMVNPSYLIMDGWC